MGGGWGVVVCGGVVWWWGGGVWALIAENRQLELQVAKPGRAARWHFPGAALTPRHFGPRAPLTQ